MATRPEQNLLHYRLAEEIGAGAMGTVWRATDTTLDRDVAVKILPDDLAKDPQLLARFEREAKLLASLDHPNLASVFGVHDAEGTRFLAMELVPGEDLADRLKRGRLELEEALPIACRIADAVEAAHERGVIHRDLKPANVRLTPDGRVKVLDFGLAKSVANGATGDGAGSDPDLAQTKAGVVLGTAPYMSPEQARCRSVDSRSDVWSFGCVLWECLTGERPFQGETISDLIAAILSREPDWSQLPENTPPGVVKVLRRCLEKDPSRRLHHIADARIDLEDLDTGPVLPARHPVRPPKRNRYLPWALVGGALGVAILAASIWGGPPVPAANPLADARFTKLTNFPGAEFDAAISRDGRFVAFVSDASGQYEVLVGQIGTGKFRKLAAGDSSDARARVRNVGFFGNGHEVWLGGGLMKRMRAVELLGGPLRNFLNKDAVNAEWSPDGTRLVYHEGTNGDPVFVAEGSGANPALVLSSKPGYHQHYPMWSRDGRWIYLTRGWETTGDVALWRFDPDGKAPPEKLTDGKRRAGYPTQIDDRTVLYVAEEANGAGPWLWALDLESGVSRRAALGIEKYSSVAASADGRRLVATISNPVEGLWTVPILEREAVQADVEPYELPSTSALAPRVRGGDLYYLSSQGAGAGLWRKSGEEVTEIWKGSEVPLLEPPAISADGRRVALTHRKGSRVRLYVMNADGTNPKLLTEEVEPRGAADWSPDGEWIVVGGSADGVNGLYRIRADGSTWKRIVDGEALNPIWSPGGNVIVYAGEQVNAFTTLKAVTPDGQRFPLPDVEVAVTRGGERVRFLPDGSGIVYLSGEMYSRGAKQASNFYLLELEPGKTPRQLTRLEDAAVTRTFDITADGTRIIFDQLRDDSDIVLIER